MLKKKYLKKCKNSEKNQIMICGIHYIITKLKKKTNVIILSRFNLIIQEDPVSIRSKIELFFAIWSWKLRQQYHLQMKV